MAVGKLCVLTVLGAPFEVLCCVEFSVKQCVFCRIAIAKRITFQINLFQVY